MSVTAVMAVLSFLFVFENLAIEFVGEHVDGCVKVFAVSVCKQIPAAYMDGCLSPLLQFLHAQDDVGVGDVIVVSFELLQFVRHVGFERVGYVYVVSGNAQLHVFSFLPLCRLYTLSRCYAFASSRHRVIASSRHRVIASSRHRVIALSRYRVYLSGLPPGSDQPLAFV
jgi:hypothetical protein